MKQTAAFAFFDVDETLVSFKTMMSFQDYYILHAGFAPKVLGPLRKSILHARLKCQELRGQSRARSNLEYYRFFRGESAAEVRACACDWYASVRWSVRPFYLPATLAVLREHQSAGREVVFVSGSSVDILAPISRELGVEHLLATRPETFGGRYTGAIKPPQTIGPGKAEVVRRFLAGRGNDGSTSYAYGDHDSDIPMLSTVGNPVIVSSYSHMHAIARARAWSVLDPLEASARPA